MWALYFRRHTQKRDMFHLFPLYYSLWGKDERHTTVLPFFHYGYKGDAWLLATPLFVAAHSDKGANTFATWLYARHRGRTELDMVTPLYWALPRSGHWPEPEDLVSVLVFEHQPARINQAFFPFWGHFERYGVSESTWITPPLQSHDRSARLVDQPVPLHVRGSERARHALRRRAVSLGFCHAQIADHRRRAGLLALQ